MLRKIQAGRTAGLAGLAALAFAALPGLAPASAAQETEEERRGWRALFRTEVDDRYGRPMLGVMLMRHEDQGVLVADVLEDSPAQEAGIMEGDLVLSVNGHDLYQPLDDEDERDFNPDRYLPEERLRALVSEVPEGETVILVVERDGEEIEFAVIPEVLPFYGAFLPQFEQLEEQFRGLGEWWTDEEQRQATLERIRELTEGFRSQERPYEWEAPGWMPPGSLRIFSDTLASGPWEMRWGGSRGAHGLDLVELNLGLGAYFGTSEGVLVADIEDDSPLGLLPGDVVVAVDGRVVDDIDELHRILDSYRSDEEISLRIFRDGARTTVTGTIN